DAPAECLLDRQRCTVSGSIRVRRGDDSAKRRQLHERSHVELAPVTFVESAHPRELRAPVEHRLERESVQRALEDPDHIAEVRPPLLDRRPAVLTEHRLFVRLLPRTGREIALLIARETPRGVVPQPRLTIEDWEEDPPRETSIKRVTDSPPSDLRVSNPSRQDVVPRNTVPRLEWGPLFLHSVRNGDGPRKLREHRPHAEERLDRLLLRERPNPLARLPVRETAEEHHELDEVPRIFTRETVKATPLTAVRTDEEILPDVLLVMTPVRRERTLLGPDPVALPPRRYAELLEHRLDLAHPYSLALCHGTRITHRDGRNGVLVPTTGRPRLISLKKPLPRRSQAMPFSSMTRSLDTHSDTGTKSREAAHRASARESLEETLIGRPSSSAPGASRRASSRSTLHRASRTP